jgi:phosphoglycerate dehydrogenase-like enzyme
MKLFYSDARPYPVGFEDELKKRGFDVVVPTQTPLDHPESIELMIGSNYFVTHDPAPFVNLAFLQLNSAGYDKIPVAKLKDMGVVVCNARGVYGQPIAEWVVMHWLISLKQAIEVYRMQTSKAWKNRSVKEAQDQEILILGTGDIASEIAKRMRPFNVKITGVNRDGRSVENFDATFALKELKDRISNYDCVILTLPLNPESKNLFHQGLIDAMKPGATLINIGRGGIIDESALANALNEGRIGYSALDVFETEPLPQESPLWDAKNSVVSPHISYSGQYSKERLATLTLRNLEKFIHKQETENRL